MTQSYQQDAEDNVVLGSRCGDERPTALAPCEERLAKIEAAIQRLAARTKVEAEAKRQRLAEADAELQRRATKRCGKVPQEVRETPADKA